MTEDRTEPPQQTFSPCLRKPADAVTTVVTVLAMLTVTICPLAAAAFEARFLGASAATLGNPHDIKLSPDGRYLFVSDVDHDRVTILSARTLEHLGDFGEGDQDGTHDVDFDASGRLYVADTHHDQVLIYRLTGLDAVLEGKLAGGVRKPEGVLAHPNGRVYVTGAGSGNIVAYRDGRVVAEAGDLSAPHDVEAAPNGDIWIADAGNDRLVRMSEALEVVTILAGSPYDFNGPRYLDVTADGTLIVADKYAHSVKVISAAGELIAVLGNGRPGMGPMKFRTPEGVELNGDTLWIADSGNDRIVMYRITFN